MKTRSLLFFLSLLSLFLLAQVRPTEISVSLDGSGDYKSIQEAVNSCRDLGYDRVTIYIKNGVYHEKLIIPSWKTVITLSGESKDSTIITNNDYSGKDLPSGADPFGRTKFSTFSSFTMLVQGDDIIIENLTIENTAGRVGQAVALHVEGDRFIARNCKIISNQDTLYATKDSSRQYFKSCHIEGTTDFIFGEATAVFEECTIRSLANSFITAASTRQHQKFGYVFKNCKLIASEEATKVYLGRPWRPYAKTVFMNCEFGSHIRSEGWDPWTGDTMFPNKEKTTFYAEYKNYGIGSNTKSRVSWSKQLMDKEAKEYRVKNIFGDWTPKQ
jgi:pectinesterase